MQGPKKRGKKTELLVEIQTVRAVPVGTPIEQLLVSWFKKKKKSIWKLTRNTGLYTLYIISFYIAIAECGIIRFLIQFLNFIKPYSAEPLLEEDLDEYWA